MNADATKNCEKDCHSNRRYFQYSFIGGTRYLDNASWPHLLQLTYGRKFAYAFKKHASMFDDSFTYDDLFCVRRHRLRNLCLNIFSL